MEIRDFVAKVERLYPNNKYLHSLVKKGEWRAIDLMTLMTKEELMAKVLAAGEEEAHKIVTDELERIALIQAWNRIMIE